MKRIAEKWYVGLITLPVITNMLTGYFDFADFTKELECYSSDDIDKNSTKVVPVPPIVPN